MQGYILVTLTSKDVLEIKNLLIETIMEEVDKDLSTGIESVNGDESHKMASFDSFSVSCLQSVEETVHEIFEIHFKRRKTSIEIFFRKTEPVLHFFS